MTQAGKVAEIFSTAGEAFTKLGNLAMALQSNSERTTDINKWADEEIDMLKTAIARFGSDVEKISELVKSKSTNQIKTALRQKAVLNLNPSSQTSTATPKPVAHITLPPPSQSKVPIPSTTITVPSMNNTPKSPTKLLAVSRTIGQKSAMPGNVVTITGNSIFDPSQQPLKKIRIDPPAMSQLLQASIQPQQVIKAQTTSGIPIVASSQGFQMILPQANKQVTNVMQIIQPNVVHQVDASASGNIDVET